MNYITQINAFYQWLDTNNLSHNGRHLWHVLMHVANGTGWKDTFNLAVSTIRAKSGMSEDMVKRARNDLSMAGLIVWTSRSGNQSAEYRLILFSEQKRGVFAPQTTPETPRETPPQTPPQPAPIPREEKTRPEERGSPEGDTARGRVFVPPTAAEVAAYCAGRGSPIDAGAFVDYYAARGWMAGRNRMRDWRAALRTWEKNAAQGGGTRAGASGNVFADLARQMRREAKDHDGA